MQPLLFLAHRIPYPPNKGDKLRSFHLLDYLARHFRVYLGAFVDDPDDRRHEPVIRSYCTDYLLAPLSPAHAKLRSLAGLREGTSLSLPYYRDARMAQWVSRTVKEQRIRRVVVFSSTMAQYVEDLDLPCKVVDFVDVDSQKWAEYARRHRWPMSWLYGREGKMLLDYERKVSQSSHCSLFVTQAEADLFSRLAPECASKVQVLFNGVDTDYFNPSPDLASPFPAGQKAVVFSGAMDYWPNEDAVRWYAAHVFPKVLAAMPEARFWIVGRSPGPAVTALGRLPGIHVTGSVPDIRPYLQHAAVVVAPLRVARGVQNKVLEAMAMARPTIISPICAQGVQARVPDELNVATDALDFVIRTLDLLTSADAKDMGRRARERILADYRWLPNLARLKELLHVAAAEEQPAPQILGASQAPSSARPPSIAIAA